MAKVGWKTHWHRHPGVRSGDQLTLGERAADRMRDVMGSWPFVFCFFGVMIAWAVVNTIVLHRVLHHKAFDPYPYILLNLFLSMMAGVQAAALLIAAKRADAIDSEIAIHTEKNTDELKQLLEENTALTLQVKKNTDLLQEISHELALLEAAVGAPATGAGRGESTDRRTAATRRSAAAAELPPSGEEPPTPPIDVAPLSPACPGELRRGRCRSSSAATPPTSSRFGPSSSTWANRARSTTSAATAPATRSSCSSTCSGFDQLVATAEALTVGARAGLDLSVLHSVLTESPASSTLLERDLLPLLKDGVYEPGLARQLACKDLRLALELADSVGVPVELSAVVERVFQQARADYGDTAGEMTPVRLYEERAGTKLRAAQRATSVPYITRSGSAPRALRGRARLPSPCCRRHRRRWRATGSRPAPWCRGSWQAAAGRRACSRAA